MKIIALEGKSNTGKSTTLGRLAKELCDKGAKFVSGKDIDEEGVLRNAEDERARYLAGNEVKAKDFAAVFEYSGKKIGVVTQGDTRKCMDYWFDDFILAHSCDIVVCACRTKGETIEKLEEENAEKLIFVSKSWVTTKGKKYDDVGILDKITEGQVRILIDIIDKEIVSNT